MADEKKVVFKSAFNGYSRSDVNEYILGMNKRFESCESSLNERAAALEKENSALKAELDDAKSKLEAADKKPDASVLAAKEDELHAMEERIDEKDTEIARLTSLNEEFDEAIAEMAAKLSQLSEDKLSQDEPVEIVRDAKSADTAREATPENDGDIHASTASQVSAIIAEASAKADNIVAKARAEAARIKINSEGEAAYIRSYLSESADRLIHTATVDINGCADKYIEDFAKSVASLQERITSLTSELDAKKADMEAYIGKCREDMFASLDTKVSAINGFFDDGSDADGEK